MKTHLPLIAIAGMAISFVNMVSAAPEIDVIQAKKSLKDAVGSIKFGEVVQGEQSSAVTFIIRNTGSSKLRNLKVSVLGAKDFVATQPAKSRLSPGGKTTFKVTFSPQQAGTRKAQVRIASNDANENPFRINVTGVGTAAPPPLLNWAGEWNTDWGTMILTQDGSSVVGTYTYDSGRITATVQGDTLVGTWSEAPSYAPPVDAGDFVLTISADRKSFTGAWRYGSTGEMSGGWNGTRVE